MYCMSLIALFTDVVIYIIGRLWFATLRLDGGGMYWVSRLTERTRVSPKLYPLITGVPQARFCVHFVLWLRTSSQSYSNKNLAVSVNFRVHNNNNNNKMTIFGKLTIFKNLDAGINADVRINVRCFNNLLNRFLPARKFDVRPLILAI